VQPDRVKGCPTRFDLTKFLPAACQLTIERVDHSEVGIVIQVRIAVDPKCPACQGSNVSYHRYQRAVRDLPVQGQHVQLHLTVRRFRCRDRNCGRKIFAEQVPALLAPRARETSRLTQVVGLVGYIVGGSAGVRLLKHLGMPASADTVVRRVKAHSHRRQIASVRILGVDDWAWRKHQRYGTILMDLERNCVIDLLPGRSAEGFACWLKSHPEVEIITRDRSTLYADGARQGAPAACA
jgi:transposase